MIRSAKIKFSTKILIQFLFLFAIIIAGASCTEKEELNKKPILNITNSSEGLKLIITGSAEDKDGTISLMKIDWGDASIIRLIYGGFEDFQESHIYESPGIYTLTITATDDFGDISTEILELSVSFQETSLAGIKESMFKVSEDEFLVLTINLHTYQELRQSEKFVLLTDVIGKMDIDFIALQECAQHKSSEIFEGIIREDNMALIISNSLRENYNADYSFVWDWSHYGWSVWEEGVAVMSKHELVDSDNRYVSSAESVTSINSRKVIYASYEIPNIGRVNLFSAHLHWRLTETDVEQNNQIINTQLMAMEKESLAGASYATSLVCGDFNGNPTSDYPWSEGYNTMMLNDNYLDSYLESNPAANTIPAQSIYNTIGGDFPGRIDYIFMDNNNSFKVIDSQIIFTPEIVGSVSDHFGVLTKISL